MLFYSSEYPSDIKEEIVLWYFIINVNNSSESIEQIGCWNKFIVYDQFYENI